jgi:hypothetical protein
VPLAEIVLDLVGEELLAAVGLHPLHRERHPGGHPVEEGQGVGGRPARVEAQDLPARAVVDGGVLVEPGPDLAGVHLHAVARDGPAVAPGTLALERGSLEPVLAVADETLWMVSSASSSPCRRARGRTILALLTAACIFVIANRSARSENGALEHLVCGPGMR